MKNGLALCCHCDLGCDLKLVRASLLEAENVAPQHLPANWGNAHLVIDNSRFACATEEKTIVPIHGDSVGFAVTGVRSYPSGKSTRSFVFQCLNRRYIVVLSRSSASITGRICAVKAGDGSITIEPASGTLLTLNGKSISLKTGIAADQIVFVNMGRA